MEVVQEKLHRMKDLYDWSLSIADDRVKDWPLMSSPLPTLGLMAVYLTMVKVGPRVMQHRPPFQLRIPLIVYNLAIMLLNLYIGVELAIVSVRLRYSWFCQPVDYSTNPDEMRIAAALWWYYISKLVEFTDTLFFILRKKTNQLTFLHIYHHSTMFCLWWIGIKWVAGGSSFLAAMMNSFVHVVMYAYYGLSAFGPAVQKYLWWKKHITCIQLIQFTSAGVLGARAIVVGCDFPLWMQYALVVYMSSFIILFGQFYVQHYRLKQKKMKGSKNGTAGHQGGANGITHNGVASAKQHMANGVVRQDGQVLLIMCVVCAAQLTISTIHIESRKIWEGGRRRGARGMLAALSLSKRTETRESDTFYKIGESATNHAGHHTEETRRRDELLTRPQRSEDVCVNLNN